LQSREEALDRALLYATDPVTFRDIVYKEPLAATAMDGAMSYTETEDKESERILAVDVMRGHDGTDTIGYGIFLTPRAGGIYMCMLACSILCERISVRPRFWLCGYHPK
jgi:hypothetical protein